MKAVKTVPRYRCDHCAKVSTKAPMVKHERRCFFNPERYCDFCRNRGWFVDGDAGCYGWRRCPYCEKAETVLHDRYDGEWPMSPELFDAMWALSDRLKEAPPRSEMVVPSRMTMDEFLGILEDEKARKVGAGDYKERGEE